MMQMDEFQPRNVYTYHGLTRVGVRFNNVSGAVLVVLSTLGAVGFPILLFLTGDRSDLLGSLACASLGGLWMGCVGWIVGFGLLNAYPTVTIEDEGLVISAFIFSRIKIPWSDVINIKTRLSLMGGVLILARHITPFHHLYGWQYAHSNKPGFIIWAGYRAQRGATWRD